MEERKKNAGKTADKGSKPVVKGAKPAAKDTKSTAKSAKPAAKDTKSAAKSTSPAAKGTRPAAKGGKAAAKPWEKMYEGKKTPAAKAGEKASGAVKKAKEKPVKEFRDFLYLLPKKTSAKSLAKELDFVGKKSIEIWEDECVLEITTATGVITFEDVRETLEKEDEKILSSLRMKQVLSCDYESTDAETVRKVMNAFLKAFGGKIASDTEDFTPFLTPEEL